MHLKSLTLKGFKSFAKPTTLEFEPGVTCVVGPNGSGKSNVVDALAWVMGEQGAKTLRGGKMEDVIFAGTATRGPLGRAEVSLTIDNSDGALPIDYTEVTIRRTMFRSGGSEYAINGQQVRLLDVQELLSDSGLGREMHVIVGQGRLDSVLHASPEDRRGFIEEAAGILKHRRRKEKTVRKLEGMEQNLQRLRDLVTEVRRQLKPLGRQAEVARRAQGIAAIVRDAKARLMADEVVTLRAQLRDANSTEQARSTERMVLGEKLDRALLRIEHLQAAQRGDAVDQARRVAFDLESVRERLHNLQLLAGQRESMLQTRLDEPALQVTVSAQQLTDARTEIEQLQQRTAAAEQAWQQTQLDTQRARTELDELDREIAAQSALLSQHDLKRTELQGKSDAAAGRLAAVRGEVLRGENMRRSAAERLEAAERELAEVESDTAAGEADSSGLDDAYEQAQDEVRDEQQTVDELRDKLHEFERERDALDARATALALAAEVNDGAEALLAAHPDGIAGRVSDHLRVTAGYETAVAAALGGFADALLATGADQLYALADAATSLGQVQLVAELTATGRDSAVVGMLDQLEQVLGERPVAASEQVSGVPAAERMLAATVFVTELPDAQRAARAFELLPAAAQIVTLRGDVLTASTLTTSGVAADEEPGASRIALVAERERATSELAQVRAEVDRIALQLADRRAALAAAKARAESALSDLRGFDAELAKRREALNRARARVESARGELERAEKSYRLASGNVDEAETKAEQAKQALAIHEQQPRPMLDASRREEFANAVERCREAEVEARLALETLRERMRSEQLRVTELQRKRAAEQEAADRAAREQVVRRAELARTQRVLAAIPPLLASLERSVTEARSELAAAERAREAQDLELRELRDEEAQLRKRVQEITEDVHALELQIYERKLQLSNLLERAASELSLPEAVLVAEYGPDQPVPRDDAAVSEAAAQRAAIRAQAEATKQVAVQLAADAATIAGKPAPSIEAEADDAVDTEATGDETAETEPTASEPDASINIEIETVPFDRAEQQARLKRAEREMHQLGRINPLALEEFSALEQRHAYLQEQLDDLLRTRTDLMKIVSDIDNRMQEVFAAAFDDTRAAFHEVFPTLFPGGAGDIRLTDPDNLLTTGIEVAVRPAGKKIDKLSLLSGGERSLAAVALLVAIFKARPSPFYIMDEVEAALDDANLGRLLEVFADLRESSQLIIITHQKRTMEIADALYGVSMHRDGISTVVGQRIRDLTE